MAVLLAAVVFAAIADLPTAVLVAPVVLANKALDPTAVLLAAVDTFRAL